MVEKNLTQDIRDALRRVFITMPVRLIDERYMHLIESYRINCEILLDFRALDGYPRAYLRGLAKRLRALGIRMTVHAPFHELFLGAPDRLVREAAVERMERAFSAAAMFRPESIIVHFNYEDKRFGFVYEEWKENIIPNLRHFAQRAGDMGAFLALENVYEENPRAMKEIFGLLKGYPAYQCLDTGHVNAFSKTGLDTWLKRMGPFIRHFHLHDNDGSADSHGPIGSGTVDFTRIAAFISRSRVKPLVTLEPHTEANIWKTLRGLCETGIDRLL